NSTVHGDLKAMNVLVSPDGIARISEFDFSVMSEASGLMFTASSNSRSGSIRWVAPEMLAEETPKRTKESDVYALGMDPKRGPDSDDPEDVKEALADVLVITGNPESESVVNCYSLWMIRFLFEPLGGIPITRDIVIQGSARGGEALWRMMLLSNIAWQVLGTSPSDIDNPPYFSTLYSHILQRLAAARCHFESSRELDRCYALGAIEQTFELVCIMCKIGTLSDVINVMRHAAPVFRRACPDSPESLVNLPSLLTTIDISLQSYATHDILLSMLTHRPMFFRYDVNYPPHLSDTSFSTDDGPGLRWLYGVPDWLMVILAIMGAVSTRRLQKS
ncbi:unnamed protein product, partial [Rhizoctonia solani]